MYIKIKESHHERTQTFCENGNRKTVNFGKKTTLNHWEILVLKISITRMHTPRKTHSG